MNIEYECENVEDFWVFSILKKKKNVVNHVKLLIYHLRIIIVYLINIYLVET